MNKILALILFLSLFASCNSNDEKKQLAIKQDTVSKKVMTHRIPKELFLYHLGILDSAAKLASNGTINCCTGSIEFIEENTGIEANTEGSYVGPLSFLKEDLRKWHEWYDKEYGRKNE